MGVIVNTVCLGSDPELIASPAILCGCLRLTARRSWRARPHRSSTTVTGPILQA